MIAQIFRQNKINLLYGESGSGKTISTIKALNKEGIDPILFDFDDNDSPEVNECSYVHIDGYKVLADKKAVYPIDRVVIVDTWHTYITAGGTIEQLEEISKHNTIIIIDHNQSLATKQDIPMMKAELVNHLGSKMWLEVTGKDVHKLHVKKCRGYRGPKIIQNWMRD